MSLLYSTQRASLANAVSPRGPQRFNPSLRSRCRAGIQFSCGLNGPKRSRPRLHGARSSAREIDASILADRGWIVWVDRRRRDYVAGDRKVLSGCLRKFGRMGWIDSICFRARSMDNRCSFNGFRVGTFNWTVRVIIYTWWECIISDLSFRVTDVWINGV